MSASSLETEVRHLLGTMIQGGNLVVLEARHSPQAFGDALVTVAGRNVLVRIVRDRGQVFGQVADRRIPARFYPLRRALRAVGSDLSREELSASVRDVAALITQHLRDLEDAFAAERAASTQKALAELGKEVSEELRRPGTSDVER